MSSTSEIHHNLLCISLTPLLVIDDDLHNQLSNLNDAIRLMRHHSAFPTKIVYIKMCEDNFDNSQESQKIMSQPRTRSAD